VHEQEQRKELEADPDADRGASQRVVRGTPAREDPHADPEQQEEHRVALTNVDQEPRRPHGRGHPDAEPQRGEAPPAGADGSRGDRRDREQGGAENQLQSARDVTVLGSAEGREQQRRGVRVVRKKPLGRIPRSVAAYTARRTSGSVGSIP
jgi:hypothetical protein